MTKDIWCKLEEFTKKKNILNFYFQDIDLNSLIMYTVYMGYSLTDKNIPIIE